MGDLEQSWYRRRTSRWTDWPVQQLVDLKQRLGTQISVVIPARNEERTVAGVVSALSRTLVSQTPLVDELVVMDSDSTDATARVAAEAGATVYAARDVAPELGTYPGKGEALWKSLLVTKGDLLVFIDADLTQWGPHFVTGLVGPLLADQHVRLVKGFYARVRTESDGSTSTEGGRVTELVARPLISLWWPQLSGVVQPLAGEWAARRSLMESLSIPVGYGVELATLMDTEARYGLDALAQVDLGQGVQAVPGLGVHQRGQLNAVADRDAQRLHQAAPGRPLARQRLDHAGQLRPPQADQRARDQLGDPAALGRGGAVGLGADPGVEPLDQADMLVGQQRPDQSGDEVRAPLGQVGVDEDQQVALGHQQRLPQRLALAGVGAQLRGHVAGSVDRRPGLGRHPGRGVGRVGVHHDQLVDQRRLADQGPRQGADHARHRALLVAGRDHHADLGAQPLLEVDQLLHRPVGPP